MIIGLISDTHIRIPGTRAGLSTLTAEELPPEIPQAMRGVDLILHAGDIYTLPVLDELETVAPILVSEGDDDPFEVVNDKRVKHEQWLTVEGITIWLSHYGQWPENSPQNPPDVIVYGHTHQSAMESHDGILHINPGSAIFPNYQHRLGTVAFLTIKSGKVEAKIVQLKGKISGKITSGIAGRF